MESSIEPTMLIFTSACQFWLCCFTSHPILTTLLSLWHRPLTCVATPHILTTFSYDPHPAHTLSSSLCLFLMVDKRGKLNLIFHFISNVTVFVDDILGLWAQVEPLHIELLECAIPPPSITITITSPLTVFLKCGQLQSFWQYFWPPDFDIPWFFLIFRNFFGMFSYKVVTYFTTRTTINWKILSL